MRLSSLLLACFASCYMSSVCSSQRHPHLPATPRPTARPSSVSSPSNPLLFGFGASLLDTGQNSAAMPRRSQADFEPYGCDYFGKPAGRWSNGRTFMDFISEGVGYGHIPPYLQVIGADFSRGVNFASSGSTVANGSQEGSTSGGLFCLLVQVEQFRDFQASVLSGGSNRRRSLIRHQQQFSDAIYIIETGANDYYKFFEGTSSDKTSNGTVSSTIAAMKTAFLKLYELGARTFVIMNVPPVGCYPAGLSKVQDSSELDENGCEAQRMSVAQMHNERLQELLAGLQLDYPAAEWVLFDAYSLFMEIYREPSKFGIEYPFRACCGAGGAYNVNADVACGMESKYINGTLVQWTKCENPSLYMMWDGNHPVETIAQRMAQGILNATHVIPPSFDIISRIQPSHTEE